MSWLRALFLICNIFPLFVAGCNRNANKGADTLTKNELQAIQSKVVRSVRHYASESDNKLTPAYYSRLRSALDEIGSLSLQSEAATDKAMTRLRESAPLRIESNKKSAVASPIDADPVFQANLEALLEAAERDEEPSVDFRPQIIGGWPTDRFTATVGIKRDFYEENICSGVLLAPNVVLSAAHCRCLRIDSLIRTGSNLNSSEPGFRIDKVDKVPKTPVTCPDPPEAKEIERVIRGKDFVIFFLQKPVPERQFHANAIATAAMIAGAKWVAAAGFGEDASGDKGTKRYVDIAIASHDCTGSVRGIPRSRLYDCMPKKELVAQNKNFNTATCYGDSGGPIYVQFKGEYYLAGITSRGIESDCRKGGIYTLITAEVIAWLRNEAKITVLGGS